MITARIDCGAKNTKTVIMKDGQIMGKGSVLTGFDQEKAAEDNLSEDDFLDDEFLEDDFPEDDLPLDELVGIRDPLEPVNRAFFVFNDKLYFWVLKPVSKGYSYIAPETVRVGISNFFYNFISFYLMTS